MGRSILLLTEDADTRSIFSAVLVRRGYTVKAAENGTTAIAEMNLSTPELIIMERLPYVRGGELVFRALRDDPRFTLTKALAVTSRLLEGQPSEMPRGYDAVMLKPLSLRVLLSEVERLIGAPETDVEMPSEAPLVQ